MPLVRISLIKSQQEDHGKRIGEIVYRAMLDALNVPDKDNFQLITEHEANSLVYDPSYLDVHRTNGIVMIQITLNEGRTEEMKKAFYRNVADTLNKELGIRMEDVFINLVEVKKEDWSFGNGVAQYAS